MTEYGTNTTGTVWDGFDPAATSSDLHGATDLFRDPYGAVAFQDGPYGNEWVLGDQRNATATAGADGAITDLVDYADFGAADYESTGWSSLVGNDQQPGDPTLGLDNYYARDYDTTTGTWVQPDEWRGLLERPQSLNRYAYIENTPVAFSDHLGYVIKVMPLDGGGRSVTAKVVGKALAKTVIARTGTTLNQDTARNAGSKFMKSLPKQGVKSPLTRSRSLLSAVHRTGIADKCSEFEPICKRPGGRESVYCSDNILGTIAPATCTMDYRLSTLMSKAVDILILAIPVGGPAVRAIKFLIEKLIARLVAKKVTQTVGQLIVFATRSEARAGIEGAAAAAVNKFFRGATSKSTNFSAQELAGGGYQLKFFSPANNAGYGKWYIQEVDALGNVLRWYKDTVGPKGLIERKWLAGGP